jgi:hypothetical protein
MTLAQRFNAGLWCKEKEDKPISGDRNILSFLRDLTQSTITPLSVKTPGYFSTNCALTAPEQTRNRR